MQENGMRWRYPEAARFLGVTQGHLRLMVHERRVPHYRLSARTVVFDPGELREYMAGLRVAPAAAAGR